MVVPAEDVSMRVNMSSYVDLELMRRMFNLKGCLDNVIYWNSSTSVLFPRSAVKWTSCHAAEGDNLLS